MIALLQRVSQASVIIDGTTTGTIDKGLLILLGVFQNDDVTDAEYLVRKSTVMRIFGDEDNKMNFSLKDIGGAALVVSQFTLCGNTRKGRRPSFIQAAKPEKGKELYEVFIRKLQEKEILVQSGRFGAMMNVTLTNDGPVTFILDSKELTS
tara:strand:+ start:156 stop:608 length:453 start_codon:yes stop_codon:yes gene_type:complete